MSYLIGNVTGTTSGIVEDWHFVVYSPVSGATIPLEPSTAYGVTLNHISTMVDVGTLSLALKAAGSAITGYSAVAVGTTAATAGGSQTIAAGTALTAVCSSLSGGPTRLAITLSVTRT